MMRNTLVFTVVNTRYCNVFESYQIKYTTVYQLTIITATEYCSIIQCLKKCPYYYYTLHLIL